MILENNGEPFTENSEPIIFRLLTLNRLVRTVKPDLFCRSLEINDEPMWQTNNCLFVIKPSGNFDKNKRLIVNS